MKETRKTERTGKNPRSDPKIEYVRTFSKNLRIRDASVKEEIIEMIRLRLDEDTKDGDDHDTLLRKFGAPEDMALELSKPENWIVDMGAPLWPKVPIRSYFSPKGRLTLSVVFIAGLIISFLFLVTLDDIGWVLSGIMILFFAFWIIMSSLLNNYLGYFTSLKEMRSSNIRSEGIGYSALKKHVLIFLIFSGIFLFLMIFIPLNVNLTAGFVSTLLSISTTVAVVLSSFLVLHEGKKIL